MSCARHRRTRVPRRRGEVLLRSAGLEARQLMSGTPVNPEGDLPLPSPTFGPCTCPICLGLLAAAQNASIESTPPAQGSLGTPTSDPSAWTTRSVNSVPAYNSLPGSQFTLYLDFNGSTTGTWGSYSNVSTPAFDTDGNASTFNSSELHVIEEVWRRVAEDYAPFNINVTTVDPGNLTNGRTLKVAIGGSYSDWFGSAAGGVGYVGGFSNSAPNTVFVFANNLQNSARYIAEAASHEAGHGFGLQHQSTYSGSTKTAEYSQGNANWAPIMGVGYYSAVTTWSNGQNAVSSTTYQDDMAIIAGSANGFGYRADDHGGTTTTATNLTFAGNNTSILGVIAQNNDQDWFRFSTIGGSVSFQVDTIYQGANLDSVLEIRNATGTIVASAAPTNSLDSSLSVTLTSGTYYAVVHSSGTYGYVGQYKLTGIVPQGAQTAKPEIDITQGTANVTSNSSFSFGSTTTGTAVTKTFTVKNSGTANLTLTPLATNGIPAGYSIASNLGATTLAAGASTTFTLKLNATAAGTFTGSITLANNDADEGSFKINLTGTVATPVPINRTLDDGDAGFTTTGQWTTVTSGFLNDARVSNKAVTGNTASWTFSSLPPGRYQVFTSYTPRADAATNAQFSLYNGTTLARTTVVNERLAPTGTAVSGVKWVSLGTIDTTGTTLKVTLSVAGNATLIADAVRIQQVLTTGSGAIAHGELVGPSGTSGSGFLWLSGGGATTNVTAPATSSGATSASCAATGESTATPNASQTSNSEQSDDDSAWTSGDWSSADFLPGAAAWETAAAPSAEQVAETTDGYFSTGGGDFQELNDRLDALDAAVASLLAEDA